MCHVNVAFSYVTSLLSFSNYHRGPTRERWGAVNDISAVGVDYKRTLKLLTHLYFISYRYLTISDLNQGRRGFKVTKDLVYKDPSMLLNYIEDFFYPRLLICSKFSPNSFSMHLLAFSNLVFVSMGILDQLVTFWTPNSNFPSFLIREEKMFHSDFI